MRAIEPARIPAPFRPFATALAGRPDAAMQLVRLLGTLGPKVPRRDAERMALLLRESLPASNALAAVTDGFLRERYPAWYIDALNDSHRNRAYAESLAATVAPGSVVVEVGTGSGLFAMLAARAGARHVYTFETNPRMVAIARDNIARNGLAERITVLAKRGEEAVIGEDLPAPGDILMHEFSADDFVISGMDETLARQRETLVTPGAPVLPCRFEARAMLSGDAALAGSLRVPGPVHGLDVGAINLLALASIALPRGGTVGTPLSEPCTLATYDLARGAALADGSETIRVTATGTGTVAGCVRWIAQHFPGGAVYENAPGRRCNWRPQFHPLDPPLPVRPGDTVGLQVTRLGHRIFVDPA